MGKQVLFSSGILLFKSLSIYRVSGIHRTVPPVIGQSCPISYLFPGINKAMKP